MKRSHGSLAIYPFVYIAKLPNAPLAFPVTSKKLENVRRLVSPAPPHGSIDPPQAAKRLSLSAGHNSSLPALAKDAPIFSPQKLSLPKSRRHTQSLRV